jgi:plastocyanin
MIATVAGLATVGANLAGAAPVRPVAATAVNRASITIRDFAFRPRPLRVRRGTVVTVSNRDSTNHSFTSNRGAFELSNLAPGRSGRVRFGRAGRFTYHCAFHPFMKGTVIVR